MCNEDQIDKAAYEAENWYKKHKTCPFCGSKDLKGREDVKCNNCGEMWYVIYDIQEVLFEKYEKILEEILKEKK